MSIRVTLTNLQKRYDSRWMLSIPHLELSAGKITGIVGSNGSGKTTLLQIIAGLDSHFEGSVSYNGNPSISQVSQTTTLVFQHSLLFKRSVYDNIAYPLKIRHVSRPLLKKIVDETLHSLEIEHLQHQRADKLSGGELQKVAIARSLVFQPRLLLLDEPISSIDPGSIQVIERTICRYHEVTGATIILITHNLMQIRRICHNLIYLENGKIEVPHGIFQDCLGSRSQAETL